MPLGECGGFGVGHIEAGMKLGSQVGRTSVIVFGWVALANRSTLAVKDIFDGETRQIKLGGFIE